MHPIIARFLDLPQAIAALEKLETETTLDSEESALIAAAANHPKSRAAVLKARGSKNVTSEAQQHLIILATHAATSRIAVDPILGPRVTSARAALLKEGASEEEADALIAQAVLEEAFGYAEDPDEFDGKYVGETLESLSHLAAVTQDTVDAWLEAFAKEGSAENRALRLSVAEAVLESAWSDGPQPITPEHIDEALERLGDLVAANEFEKATATVEQFLAFLFGKHVIGRERQARLTQIVKTAGSNGADPFEGEEQDGDDEAADE
ncbi:MAG: hypothetical protein DI536_05560 [Archangium gephyra]|uniref:Uncharacterized protein n=1 Tax=Archangium gephyra TaxID=48 RepID=A0A2W5TW55_9BACT|nr:MAG: hypothetical protein DI536_05560 [Archangium gephyra]